MTQASFYSHLTSRPWGTLESPFVDSLSLLHYPIRAFTLFPAPQTTPTFCSDSPGNHTVLFFNLPN